MGTYELEELKRRYLEAIDADDDVLTQNVDGDALRARVRSASDFAQLVDVWDWMETDSAA